MSQFGTEFYFDQIKKQIISDLGEKSYDLVIGVPFTNETDSIGKVLESIDTVVQSWMGVRQLIVCAGDAAAQENLAVIRQLQLKHPHIEFLLPREISGRGTAIRTFIAVSHYLEADLIIFDSSMATEHGPGMAPAWLDRLLSPIQGKYDMVLANLRHDAVIDSIANMMAGPILETFYGSRLGDPLGRIYALSHDFVEELHHEGKFWGESICGAGIDIWLVTRALCWSKNICEASLGGAVSPTGVKERNVVFQETAHAVFEVLKRDSAIWLQDRLIIKVVDTLARSEITYPGLLEYPVAQLRDNFQKGLSEYDELLSSCLAPEVKSRLQDLCQVETAQFRLDDDLWIEGIFDLLLAYVFDETLDYQDIISAVTALYNAKAASYALEMTAFNKYLQAFPDPEKNELLVKHMESGRQNLAGRCWALKPEFIRKWLQKTEQNKPPLVPLGYMEYVPGKPIVVPKKMVGKDGHVVQTDNVYRAVRKRYEDAFNQFISVGMGLAPDAEAGETVMAVEKFMQQVEQALQKILPGDLHSESGIKLFVNRLFEIVPHHEIFAIHSDLLREMLVRFPPVNLMIPLGYFKPAKLLKKMEVRDAVTYANLLESWSYTDRDLLWLLDQLKPESFQWVELKPLIMDEKSMGFWPHSKVAHLNRITARVTVKPLQPGGGGKYPRLRYFTSIVRRMCVAENYSLIFKLIVKQHKNIGTKVKNSLLGLQKGDEASAHNIFENYHHRALVEKIRCVARECEARGDAETARLFNLLADGYGLCQVLANGTFLTCTGWSWASYSFKGGVNAPTPLTTSVESRWFNHDFMESLYRELGYDEKEIKQTVLRLIQSESSSNNILDTLLPTRPRDVTVVVQETTNEPSKLLQRYSGNPILEPVEAHPWESKYVLNPGALRIKDKVYLFYRAVGEDNVSYIGLAVTDGYKLLERLPEPIFSPAVPEEKMGCEDPRLTIIDDRIFMLYTAYNGNIAQIAAASISVEDFLQRRFTAWKREGLAFKNIWDKDAILFPEKIKGKYVIYHRIEPSIWVTYMNQVAFPCREKHAIIIGPRPGRMWDSLKIGAGAQPLKTKYGWLLIYHGVDYNYVYRLGVILVDLENPQKVIYRSPNPVLEPEEDYEIGLSGAWVPNVVFTCGAVAGSDKEILEDDDVVLVYYGAADTSIGVATATLADLIPEQFRFG